MRKFKIKRARHVTRKGGNEKCIQNCCMWTSTVQHEGQENTVRCDTVSERKTPGDGQGILSLWIPLFFLPPAFWLNQPIFCGVTWCTRLKSVTSYWMANGYRRFEDLFIFIFLGQAAGTWTAWTRRWIYWKCLYVFTNENDVTAETTWIFRNTRVPKISHCFLFVKMSSCCCLVWTVEILLAVASLCEGKWAKWIPEWIF